MTELPQELRDLLDKQAIVELVQTYCRLVDRHDFAPLRDLYTGDGTDDHGALYNGPADGYVAWLRGAMAGKVETSHAVHNHMVALLGRGEAEGEVYVTAYNRIPDGNGGYIDFIQGLRYLDKYRKEAGRWRFAKRKVLVDWAHKRPSLWDFGDPLMEGKHPSIPGPDDASYGYFTHPLFKRG